MDLNVPPVVASFLCRCDRCCLSCSPETVEVKDAGTLEVNGTYKKMNRLVMRAVSYEKKGAWNGAFANFYIVLCCLKNCSYEWSICFTPQGIDPGTDSDVDFYVVPCSEHISFLPPRDGWKLISTGAGIRPLPMLVCDEQMHLGRQCHPRVGGEAMDACSKNPGNTTSPCLSDLLELKAFDPMIQEAARYWSYVHTMKLWSCHEKIYAALFQFIFAAPHYRASARKNVVETIGTCTRKEQCVMLELAVWKFLCTMQCPSNLRGILDVSEWCKRGWKIRKTQARRSNAFHIIITSVLPFMDPSLGL
jgi:hypothetical protein